MPVAAAAVRPRRRGSRPWLGCTAASSTASVSCRAASSSGSGGGPAPPVAGAFPPLAFPPFFPTFPAFEPFPCCLDSLKIEPKDYRYPGFYFQRSPHWGDNRISP